MVYSVVAATEIRQTHSIALPESDPNDWLERCDVDSPSCGEGQVCTQQKSCFTACIEESAGEFVCPYGGDCSAEGYCIDAPPVQCAETDLECSDGEGDTFCFAGDACPYVSSELL